jgi:hypothetical protein
MKASQLRRTMEQVEHGNPEDADLVFEDESGALFGIANITVDERGIVLEAGDEILED